jgi:hypothetical protein
MRHLAWYLIDRRSWYWVEDGVDPRLEWPRITRPCLFGQGVRAIRLHSDHCALSQPRLVFVAHPTKGVRYVVSRLETGSILGGSCPNALTSSSSLFC